MKKITLILLIGLIIGLVFVALFWTNFVPEKNRIEITNEFIINDNWDEYNHAIRINKMTVLDNRLDVFSKGFIKNSHYWDFENSLENDKTFNCSYWGKEPFIKDKVYFDKNNGWSWNVNGIEKPTIGKLENGTWYKFSNLLMNTKYYKYVYVDSIGKTHVFSVNKANY
ncbi:hypothetical protein [Xanthomarina gelatinilytica]|uniref:hypothetical protein n=1 Tax=Xanthomarina gelatinilytica TaxID=1137281 RepID=UPI003AA8EE63